jgi:hypothetical protein
VAQHQRAEQHRRQAVGACVSRRVSADRRVGAAVRVCSTRDGREGGGSSSVGRARARTGAAAARMPRRRAAAAARPAAAPCCRRAACAQLTCHASAQRGRIVALRIAPTAPPAAALAARRAHGAYALAGHGPGASSRAVAGLERSVFLQQVVAKNPREQMASRLNC